MKFNNIHFSEIDTKVLKSIPGRGDLRIALTTFCNLKCAHCHNEGVAPPWEKEVNSVSLDEIEALLAIGNRHGARSVKFTGGEPTLYHSFLELLGEIANWRYQYKNIEKWGISTNGVLFLSKKYYTSLVESELDNICIGIDSISKNDNSKPSSSIGVQGYELFNKFVVPLKKDWNKKSIKINVVYNGDQYRVKEVVAGCVDTGINVSIIEVNTASTNEKIRNGFISLFYELQSKYNCFYRYNKELNENHLYLKERNNRISFYQDHCADLDCGHCRNIHLRISPVGGELGVLPCFLRDVDGIIKISENGKICDDKFLNAYNCVGRGPDWMVYNFDK